MPFDLGQFIWVGCYFLVLVGLSAYGLHRYCILFLYLKHRRRPVKPAGYFSEETLPWVTVQLPIFNELHVVERLLESVSRLDYPRDRLEIQILDDSTDETRQIAQDCGAKLRAAGLCAVHLHRSDRTGFKAGALEAGLKVAKGGFVLILDADFVPGPDLLRKTIHYFTDPKIGMIQTRWGHLNRDYSWLTRVQAMFLDGHLLLEQTARSRSGRFFNFNGTAGLWRRSCIEDAGGWQHDTLTEDLDLSYRAQLRGWHFVFLADVVTPAELPIEMNGFKSQQHRWTKGSIQTCRKILPAIWKSSLPWKIKFEATCHLTSNFAYLLLALLCLLSHPALGGLEYNFMRGLLMNVLVFVAASVSAVVFYVFALRELYPARWKRDILLLPLLLAVGIGLSLNNARAVLEAVFGHVSEFTRTPKYGIVHQSGTWRGARYLPMKSLLSVLEFLFAGLFAYFLFVAVATRQYLSVPFLLLFFGGFLYVAVSSVLHWLPNPFTRSGRGRSEPALA